MKKINLLFLGIGLKMLRQLNKKKSMVRGLNESTNLSLENSGERSNHIMPEVGECHLAKALIQFEQERAKSLTIA